MIRWLILKMITVEFANSVDQDKVAHTENDNSRIFKQCATLSVSKLFAL